MNEIHMINGQKVIIWKAHLKDVFPNADEKANPFLWFAKDLQTKDLVVCGFRRKKDVIGHIEQITTQPK